MVTSDRSVAIDVKLPHEVQVVNEQLFVLDQIILDRPELYN